MNKIYITLLIFLLVSFFGCGLLVINSQYSTEYKQSTCAYHTRHELNFPKNTISLGDYTVYPEQNKDIVKERIFNKGRYYISYYHCQGPIGVNFNIIDTTNNNNICKIDFSLAKRDNIFFSIPKSGKYKLEFKTNLPKKWAVHYYILWVGK